MTQTPVEVAYPDSRVMQKEEARIAKLLKQQRRWIGIIGLALGVLGVVVVNLGLMADNPYASAYGGVVALMGVVYCLFWAVDRDDE